MVRLSSSHSRSRSLDEVKRHSGTSCPACHPGDTPCPTVANFFKYGSTSGANAGCARNRDVQQSSLSKYVGSGDTRRCVTHSWFLLQCHLIGLSVSQRRIRRLPSAFQTSQTWRISELLHTVRDIFSSPSEDHLAWRSDSLCLCVVASSTGTDATDWSNPARGGHRYHNRDVHFCGSLVPTKTLDR